MILVDMSGVANNASQGLSINFYRFPRGQEAAKLITAVICGDHYPHTLLLYQWKSLSTEL